jgi:hypothetical protein
MEKKISVEPTSYSLTGFKTEDLFSKKFVEALKKEMPTVIPACLCFGFSDNTTIIQVGHDRREGKFDLEHVSVSGDGPRSEQKVKCVVEVLKKVLT